MVTPLAGSSVAENGDWHGKFHDGTEPKNGRHAGDRGGQIGVPNQGTGQWSLNTWCAVYTCVQCTRVYNVHVCTMCTWCTYCVHVVYILCARGVHIWCTVCTRWLPILSTVFSLLCSFSFNVIISDN